MKMYAITEGDLKFLKKLKTRLYEYDDKRFEVNEARDYASVLDARMDHFEELEV